MGHKSWFEDIVGILYYEQYYYCIFILLLALCFNKHSSELESILLGAKRKELMKSL